MEKSDILKAESTRCDYKVTVEKKRPKSWLKSVSAFANGVGGSLVFGIDDDKNVVGLEDAQAEAEAISRLIRERITPYPSFVLTPEKIEDKDILVLNVLPGRMTPYYYKADGIQEAYIRVGNDTVVAPDHILNQLLLNGMNMSYDALVSHYNFSDYSFSKLRERYKAWTGNSMEDKLFESFGIKDKTGRLTNAGALIADDSPIKNSRLFCTRWDGLDKSGGLVDALDSEEYSGSLIILLNEGVSFIKRNMKTMWKKTSDSRIEMPDYIERSFFEGLVNALIHRDYLILGSEVHIDIFDDRLTIYSPGGMPDGTLIQNRDLNTVSSTRRNPVLADIFGRLGYMERQGSGLSKIKDAYEKASNFSKDKEPSFYSDQTQFTLTLPNLNYHNDDRKVIFDNGKVIFEDRKVIFDDRKVIFDNAVNNLTVKPLTKEKIHKIFDKYGFDDVFSRSDVACIINITPVAAGKLIKKLSKAGLLEEVVGQGNGKYKFRG